MSCMGPAGGALQASAVGHERRTIGGAVGAGPGVVIVGLISHNIPAGGALQASALGGGGAVGAGPGVELVSFVSRSCVCSKPLEA